MYLFILFWLRWVFVVVRSPYSACAQYLWHAGSLVVVHGLRCPARRVGC